MLDAKISEANDRTTNGNILSAKILIEQIAARGKLADIREAEFKVFSQYGEDGIIQYLIRQAKIPANRHTFVEFGVESYIEANTRFLLMNNNWRGLVIDGSKENIAAIQNAVPYWKYDLTAIGAFVDADNINRLIEGAGFGGEIGLLNIDMDGNDYWVWDRINVVDPIIVVVEYNSVFGSQRAVTVPYDPKFLRSEAHYSYLYWGASLKALELLGRRKGTLSSDQTVQGIMLSSLETILLMVSHSCRRKKHTWNRVSGSLAINSAISTTYRARHVCGKSGI